MNYEIYLAYKQYLLNNIDNYINYKAFLEPIEKGIYSGVSVNHILMVYAHVKRYEECLRFVLAFEKRLRFEREQIEAMIRLTQKKSKVHDQTHDVIDVGDEDSSYMACMDCPLEKWKDINKGEPY